MNRRNRWTLLAMLISGVSTWKASANGFGLPDQDAFATARGEAFVATADNPRPFITTRRASRSLQGTIFAAGWKASITSRPSSRRQASPTVDRLINGSNNFAYLPQFFYTHTAKTVPLSFGLGVYAPFGGKMNWPQDTGFRTVATSGSLKYITINPVVAVKLSPSFPLGGGVMVNYGNIDMDQGLLTILPATPLPTSSNFTGDGWSVGYNLGLLWQPNDKISFGATFRSSAS